MDDNAPVTKRELKEELTHLKDELKKELKEELTEMIRDVETSLLTAFHGYGKGQALRMHVLEVTDSATAQRLAALEERILNLETRRGPGSH
jgi:sulfite reductase beta subunit-like hemoprotein